MGYTFNISLSVLNHLGRNLYRNFITVIGEAISNSWDADASNVWIEVDRDNKSMFIVDDGSGMSSEDFQTKFLKIGYSKRKDGELLTPKGRSYIGRKGIGKLALLSCSKKVSIATKKTDLDIVGGQIDNSGLDIAIQDDKSANEYTLSLSDRRAIDKLSDRPSGTSIYFEELNDGVFINKIDYLRKLIALSFRFSLIDRSFTIHLNGDPVTVDALNDLASSTQFVWEINQVNDDYLSEKISPRVNQNVKNYTQKTSEMEIAGFIASTNKPSDLKIKGTNEKITLDLFVNGRLREKDVLKHIPTARIVENYLYGQIHFDRLDYSVDAFTSSREGVKNDDPLFTDLLKELEIIVRSIIAEWDTLRQKVGADGDPDNESITKKSRKAKELFNVTVEEILPEKPNRKVESWISMLSKEAQYNIPSYTDCFISENMLREFIRDKRIPLTTEAQNAITTWKQKERDSKAKANISFDVRQSIDDLEYLSVDDLSNLVDKPKNQTEPGIARDAKVYKPVRDAIAHTSLITDNAKNQLSLVFENVKARLRTLLS